ncbi:MAG: PP2C family protein-serine/threonine phosphatase, partial [Janthinobacterium lividum]
EKSSGHSPGFQRDPAYALKQLNRNLCSPALPAACASVSLSLVVLNTKTGEAMCACAGSEPPLILRARGQIETLRASRMALGIETGRTYQSVDFRLGKGDALLLATDGITKAQKTKSGGSTASLHYEGLTGLALEAFSPGSSPGQMARTVLSGARAFAGGTFRDHASVLIALRR